MLKYEIQKQLVDTKQHFKIADIATYITRQLLKENCTQNDYYEILKIVEQRLLNKSEHEPLVLEE